LQSRVQAVIPAAWLPDKRLKNVEGAFYLI